MPSGRHFLCGGRDSSFLTRQSRPSSSNHVKHGGVLAGGEGGVGGGGVRGWCAGWKLERSILSSLCWRSRSLCRRSLSLLLWSSRSAFLLSLSLFLKPSSSSQSWSEESSYSEDEEEEGEDEEEEDEDEEGVSGLRRPFNSKSKLEIRKSLKLLQTWYLCQKKWNYRLSVHKKAEI